MLKSIETIKINGNILNINFVQIYTPTYNVALILLMCTDNVEIRVIL